jgi:ribosomal protein RSM22 (predicted rRNA methylase)
MNRDLQTAIEAMAASIGRRALASAADEVSASYRGAPERPVAGLTSPAARVAYLVTRFPATLAALRHVALELDRRLDLGGVRTLLELGAGPCPARWAFAGLLDPQCTLESVDADAGMLALAEQVCTRAPVAPAIAHRFTRANLAILEPAPADLVVASYALGELDPRQRERLLGVAWGAAQVALVIVEPGTMAGCERVLDARRRLIAAGAHVLAPCPHDRECPTEAPDWCHFAVRLERSRLHRQLKHAALGYEDEKFSYVVAARRPGRPALRRLVARPTPHSGHVVLRLCERDGLATRTCTRREGARFKEARRAKWGDGLDW